MNEFIIALDLSIVKLFITLRLEFNIIALA